MPFNKSIFVNWAFVPPGVLGAFWTLVTLLIGIYGLW